jgi:hypothetical protein
MVSGRTGGLAPGPPRIKNLILPNSTWIGLNLTSWDDGGCPISSLVIEYQLEGQDEPWHLVSNNVKQEMEIFTIYDLQPSTSYTVKMTAHNSAGSSAKTYTFITLDTGTGAVRNNLLKFPHSDGGLPSPFLNTMADPSTPSWNVLAPLLALSSLLLAGGAYVFHGIVKQFTETKVPTMTQCDTHAGDMEQY